MSVYSAIFGMVTNERPTEQPGDPSASLLLTSVRRQSFAKTILSGFFPQLKDGKNNDNADGDDNDYDVQP